MNALERLERAFSEYDVDPEDQVNAYFSSQDPKLMESMFDSVREEVARDGCFPLLVRRKDDYAFYIMRERPRPARRTWLAALLLAATVATTVMAGAVLAEGRAVDAGEASPGTFAPAFLLEGGLLFALPVLLILAARESMRRYAAARHGIDASLPYFVPIPPPLSFVGTLGAFANLRTPAPTRRALAEVGGSAALAGFVAALVVLGIGLALSTPAAAPADESPSLKIGEPLAFALLRGAMHGGADLALHPLAIAGWVGLFVTSISLLPVASFDGGMVARSLLGRRAAWLGLAAVSALAVLGVWGWLPWLVLAVALLVGGVLHSQPLNEVTPPGARATTLALLCVLALVLSFTPVPLGV